MQFVLPKNIAEMICVVARFFLFKILLGPEVFQLCLDHPLKEAHVFKP